MPGSEPPVPDRAQRLAEVVEALKEGSAPPGLHISEAIARILISSEIVHDRVIVGGVDHFLYELSANGATWAALSPEIGG